MYLGINTREESNPVDEIRTAFLKNGIALPPEPFEFDGMVHRFRADPLKPKDNDNGWYVFFENGSIVNGVFGDWATDLKVTFHSSGFDSLSLIERQEQNRKIQESIQQAEEEKTERHEAISISCETLWNTLPTSDGTHPYIALKGLKNAHGARLDGDQLVVPLMDKDGRIWSLQRISANGEKKYKAGGKVKGCFYQIGEGTPRFLCEGFATGCSINEATKRAVVIAYSANNMIEVAKLFPDTLVVADNDENQTGEIKAKKTGNKWFLIPEVGCDANDYALKYGVEKLAELLRKFTSKYHLVDGSEWLFQSKPKEWLIRNYILKGKTLTMIFGKSGNGKTFVVVEMIMALATGIKTTLPITKKCKVLYLCGEGDESVKERMAVWYQQHDVDLEDIKQNLKIEPLALKMDNQQSAQLLVQEIHDSGFVPDIIFIDTLARYMGGDENDTKSANEFVAACDYLENEFDCGVVLVHHTGQAEDTQKRERGSSVFRGALDMQLRVEKKDNIIKIVNTKNKGGKELEGLQLELVDHVIDGFIEEDGSSISCAILVPCNEPEIKQEKHVGKKQLEDENLIIHAFFEKGKLIMGKPYIKAEDLIDWLVIQNDSSRNVERRKISIRDVDYKDKPRLMERLEMYGDIEADWEGKNSQVPRGFWCNEIERDGLVQPHFDMSLG